MAVLTLSEAKKCGRDACIEKLGRDFYEKNKKSSTTAYGEFSNEGVVFCYVGVDDKPQGESDEVLILSNYKKKNPIPFCASCNVNLQDETIEFLECNLPN